MSAKDVTAPEPEPEPEPQAAPAAANGAAPAAETDEDWGYTPMSEWGIDER